MNQQQRIDRAAVCESAAAAIRRLFPTLSKLHACIGFDGFVDEIARVVDQRTGPNQCQYVPSIAELGRKISLAAGQSANHELVSLQMRVGGNAPNMAAVLAELGMNVACIGSFGWQRLESVFEPLARRMQLLSIAPAGQTLALEFQDGKLMFNRNAGLAQVSWENLLARVGREKLIQLMSQSSLLGTLNWTMLADMDRIWTGLMEEIFPHLSPLSGLGSRMLMVDLADPHKRTGQDLSAAMATLGRLQSFVELTLGLNQAESDAVAKVLGVAADAAAIREKIGIACVVIHPRQGASAATKSEAARIAGPFVRQPMLSTGAGDHFNAGFCAARVLGMDLPQSLCAAVGTSGYFVRHGKGPDARQLADFVENLPLPEVD